MAAIDDTLAERGSRYGAFTGHAQIAQDLKAVMQAAPSWPRLQADQKEALDMVQHKIARILNGDPDYIDSWHDIVGYVKLVEDRLIHDEQAAAAAKLKAQADLEQELAMRGTAPPAFVPGPAPFPDMQVYAAKMEAYKQDDGA